MSRTVISSRGKKSYQDPLPRTDLEVETIIHEGTEARGDSYRKSFFASCRKAPKIIKLRTGYASHLENGHPKFDKPGNWYLLSETSKSLLTRFRGSRSSGTGGQEFKRRSVTLLRRRNSSPTRGGNNSGCAPSHYFWETSRSVDESKEYNEDDSPPGPLDQDSKVNDLDIDDSIQGSAKNQVSNNIFDDDTESGAIDTEEETKTSDEQEYRNKERSAWASTLLASTLAKQKAMGKTMTRDISYLLPRPEQAKNKVEYLIMICKAAKAYASTQAEKLTSLHDGQHMINQLRDVANDLHRQQSKILAVYDTKEVCKSVDCLGETLKDVYELLGDIEDTHFMFGKRKKFGARISALVHDIGTYSNALLVSTSLAIADRPNILYMTDTCNGEPPAPQKEELKRMCIEGDKHFFGRGETKSLKKAFEVYSWVAKRGGVEAMVMLASMYRAGTYVEADKEKCRFWLERAVDKGYIPAMNDMAIVLLGEADRLEEDHPEIKCGIVPSETPEANGGSNEGNEFIQNIHKGISSLYQMNTNGQKEDYHRNQYEVGEEPKSSWTPEQEKLFEKVMEKRKQAMCLLQEAAQTGHMDAMTNLGNMQEAMGYFDDARDCYSMAAEPSESANNPRAQNYLGALYFHGRGVPKDLDEAVKWFRRSALQGNAQACRNLGTCYEAGLGVSKDQSKAVELFRQAVEGGSVSAANDLAYVLAKDALNTLASVARQAPACIHSGDAGLKGDNPPFGTTNSGDSMSEASRQVWRDSIAKLREASDLFRRAAESGISDASYQLGMLYQQGLGIPVDPVAAFENFLVAANGSTVHTAAATCVGDMLYSGTGCLRDYREALRYYLRAAKTGESKSANAVGLMYELGRGVSRDLEAALEWYIRAASLGSADGAFNGALLLERGDPVSVIASAAGLTDIPEKYLGASLASPTPIRVAADSARHVQGTSNDERDGCHNCGQSCETQQHNRRAGQEDNQNTHENDKALSCRHNGNNRGDRASAKDNGSGVECHRADKENGPLHPWKLGNRPLALQMFERAADLGHPGAAQEIRRLKLREKFNHLERMGK